VQGRWEKIDFYLDEISNSVTGLPAGLVASFPSSRLLLKLIIQFLPVPKLPNLAGSFLDLTQSSIRLILQLASSNRLD
jgi:hypothetical protein